MSQALPKPNNITDCDVCVFVRPSIFAQKHTQWLAHAGDSIADILTMVEPDAHLHAYARVMIAGDMVPRTLWASVRVKSGAVVSIVFVPQGKGKNPLATIASIALMAAAPGIGNAIAASFGGGIVWNIGATAISWGRVIAGAVTLIGGMVINALAPPPKPKAAAAAAQEKTTQFITGAQNQYNLYGAVPVVLGKMRMVPAYGTRPFTEQVGDDQYVRMLFVWGYGPLQISDIRIGDTLITEYQDVEIETRQGFADDPPITIITNQPRENQLSITLAQDVYNTQTTGADTDTISIDVTFSRGLVRFAGDGSKKTQTVEIAYEYSVAGAGVWTAATLTVTQASSTAFVRNVSIPVARGQYDVRLKRVTPASASTQIFDEVVWSALRSIRNDHPVNMPGVAMTAVRIRATDQLNGVINQLNGVVESLVPDYHGTDGWAPVADQNTWTATSSPAALFRYVLQCAANARAVPDSSIDLDALAQWHDDCASAGYEYNNVIDGQRSIGDMLSAIAAAGRAREGRPDGKWLAIMDKERPVTVQHFTPRNSWGFSAQKAFVDLPHAFRVKFINREKNWQEDERVVYDDGYSQYGEVPGTVPATKFAALDLSDGITSADMAWKCGRYHIATVRLRPETFTFNADFENIVVTRGDKIRFAHDVCLIGLGNGRIKAVNDDGNGNALSVGIDDAVFIESGKTYNVRIRLSNGATLLRAVNNTMIGENNTLIFAVPVPLADYPLAGGELYMFGETAKESIELIVRDIERSNDMVAKITAVNYAPEVFTADQGAIPPFDSGITIPPDMMRPPAPVIVAVQSGDESLIVNADLSFQPSIVITLAPPDFPYPLSPTVRLRRTDESVFLPAPMTYSNGTLVITGVESGSAYDVQIVYQNPYGVYSAATLSPAIAITGGQGKPEDVTGFSVNVISGNAYLKWDKPEGLKVAYYKLKFSHQTVGADWSYAVQFAPPIPRTATSMTVPSLVGTYLLKAVGWNGEESTVAARVVSAIAGLTGFSPIESINENPAFSGVKEGVKVASSTLELDGTTSGTYYFASHLDLEDVYTVRLSAIIEAAGHAVSSDGFDEFENVDEVWNIDGDADPSRWNVVMQISTTTEAPDDSGAEWSAWQDFVIGDYTIRGARFRSILTSSSIVDTPSVGVLRVDVDAPPQDQSSQNLTSSSADAPVTPVVFPTPFKGLKGIGISTYDMDVGDYYTLSGTNGTGTPDETGFGIVFRDAGGARITRKFGFVATGFGLKQ